MTNQLTTGRLLILVALIVAFSALALIERRRTRAIYQQIEAVQSGRIKPVLRHGEIDCLAEDEAAGYCRGSQKRNATP